MSKKRNRGNGSGSVFKRRDDGPYCIAWFDANGQRREHNTLTTDKQAAERILAKRLTDVALRRDGIIDARQESLVIQSTRPIEGHLADFEAMMTARQRSQDHIKRTVAFVREVCTAAGFKTPSDITADGVNKIVTDMKEAKKAARTIQGRIVAAKAFTKWLADHGKLAYDPLRSVKRPSVKDGSAPAPADAAAGGMALSPRGHTGERLAGRDDPSGARRLVRARHPERASVRGVAVPHEVRSFSCQGNSLRLVSSRAHEE